MQKTVQLIRLHPWITQGLIEPHGRPEPMSIWLMEGGHTAREVEPVFGWAPYRRVVKVHDDWGYPVYYLAP